MLTRRRLRQRTLLALALFVAANALPRASVYVHRHAGGGHLHVHPWGEDADGHDDAGVDDGEPAPSPGGGPVLEHPGARDAAHTHTQEPFQHATHPGLPALVRATVVRAFSTPRLPAAGGVSVRPTRARGPPPARRVLITPEPH
ncbi:MAG TPA: hypothetical protein VFD84_11405 [Candidatus Binatia bacterium]|nr:hypothetical protein [Candidatus Binatia bacterium]